jgi:hypothetical protein
VIRTRWNFHVARSSVPVHISDERKRGIRMMNDIYGVPPHLLLEVYTTLGDLFRSGTRDDDAEAHAAAPVDGTRATPAQRPAFALVPGAQRKERRAA